MKWSNTVINVVFKQTNSGDYENPSPRFQVHVRTSLIINGVCVRWKGWVDLDRLEGMGCIEFDDEMAKVSYGNLGLNLNV